MGGYKPKIKRKGLKTTIERRITCMQKKSDINLLIVKNTGIQMTVSITVLLSLSRGWEQGEEMNEIVNAVLYFQYKYLC